MPFTASHPAAIVPLLRLGLVPSALVIGSMAPDFPYYLPIAWGQGLTHSALGIVTVDLLLGLAAFILWQLSAPSLLALAPAGLRARVPSALPVPLQAHCSTPRATLLVAVALIIGATTHVIWDAFTHPDRFGTHHIPWLAADHAQLPGYSWAQYASGILGLTVLAATSWRWWLRTAPVQQATAESAIPRVRASTAAAIWALIAGIAASTGLASFVATWSEHEDLNQALFHGATRGGAAGAAAVLMAVAFVGLRSRAANAD